MLENFIMQVRRPKGVSGKRVAFVSRAAACSNKNYRIFVYQMKGRFWSDGNLKVKMLTPKISRLLHMKKIY